jgi:HlyD family secretion protein
MSARPAAFNEVRMRKSRKLGLLVGALVVIAGATWGFARLNGAVPTIDPSKVATAERGTMTRSVVATGKVEPITKVEIKSKASGIVKKLYIEAGDHVKKGQILAELDREEIQANVRASEAQLSSSEANQRAAEAEFKRSEVDAEGPDIPMLKRAYERAGNMAKQGVVSQSNLDDAQKAYELALNKQNVARAVLTVNKAKVAQATADVQRQRANLEQLREQLSYTTITAPIDGIVLSRDVEIGDAVSSILVLGSSATLVMTLGDTQEVYVKGKVDESDIGKVYLGQRARIKVESFKDKTFDGKVTKISPMGVEKDNVTTFEVRASIQNPGGELKAEMTANAEVILVEIPNPKAKDGKDKVAVNIGISNGAKTEVLSGLKEGDQVVLQ